MFVLISASIPISVPHTSSYQYTSPFTSACPSLLNDRASRVNWIHVSVVYFPFKQLQAYPHYKTTILLIAFLLSRLLFPCEKTKESPRTYQAPYLKHSEFHKCPGRYLGIAAWSCPDSSPGWGHFVVFFSNTHKLVGPLSNWNYKLLPANCLGNLAN